MRTASTDAASARLQVPDPYVSIGNRRMPPTFRLVRNPQCALALYAEISSIVLESERHRPGPTNHQARRRHTRFPFGDIDNCAVLRHEDSELRLVNVLFSRLQNCIPEQSLVATSDPQ